MNINMGLGTSDTKSRFAPAKGISRGYGRDHVTKDRNVYDAKQELARAIARKAEINQ